MISYAVLLRSGYDFFRDISISAVIAKEGYRYYKSMQDVIRSESDGDLTYFIEYYLDLLARSIDEKAEQEQRRQRDALLRERKLAATPLGGDRPPEKEPRVSAQGEDAPDEAEATAENAGNAEMPLLPDESPPVQLYTYEEYLSLLHDTRKKHMSRIQPERVERLCSRLEEFARNGPHVFRRAQWAELTGIPLGISKEDVFLMNKFGLIFCENIAESRSRAIKIYRIPLIPGERQPEPEVPSEDAGIRATLKLMLNSEYSRERQVAAGLLDMLDQGKQEFDYAEWNSRNPATSKDSGFAVLRVGLNRGLIEFDEGTYRIVPKVKSGPQCYPMPDKQRDVLLRLIFNKQWEQMSVQYRKLDKIDKLAHRGVIDEPDYYACIEEQLSFFENLHTVVRELFKTYRRVVITGDHGTSRIAARMFHEKEGLIPPKDASVCSFGRYCRLEGETSMTYDTAVLVKDVYGNRYQVFRTYDHFKSSGCATGTTAENILYGEVHGGASPEEMIVPVVVFDSNRELPLTAKWEKSKVRLKKKQLNAVLNFSRAVVDLQVTIGNHVAACETDDEVMWTITVKGIAPDTYNARIVADGQIVAGIDPLIVTSALEG